MHHDHARPHPMVRAALALLLLALAPALWAAAAEPALREVVLQLKWKHQFQFAGYYAAEAQGYYRQAGLRLKAVEPTASTDPALEVLEGRAHFGVGTTELVLDRARGRDVVVLAVIMQHSPFALATLKASGISHVHQLAGRRLMAESDTAELWAYLRSEGLPAGRYQLVPHSYRHDELLSGQVDALAIYTTDEPFVFQQAGVEVQLFLPRSAGIDFYGDNLFTSGELLRRDPALVRAFLAASLRGWQYALDHPGEVAALIRERYSQRRSAELLLTEAKETRRLILPELLEIGYMNPGRWRYIAEVYREQGMLAGEIDWEHFLYLKPEPRDLSRLYGALAALLLGGLAMVAVAGHIWRLNRGLKEEIRARARIESELNAAYVRLNIQLQEISELKAQLESEVDHDPLTGLFNRRHLGEVLHRELARTTREGAGLAVLLLDLDHFKDINDRYGHPCGDQVLHACARYLEGQCRPSDHACRYGGEEFLLILPHMGGIAVRERAEQLRQGMGTLALPPELAGQRLTVSIGVALAPQHGHAADELIQAADLALYHAKHRGRDRVEIFGPAHGNTPRTGS